MIEDDDDSRRRALFAIRVGTASIALGAGMLSAGQCAKRLESRVTAPPSIDTTTRLAATSYAPPDPATAFMRELREALGTVLKSRHNPNAAVDAAALQKATLKLSYLEQSLAEKPAPLRKAMQDDLLAMHRQLQQNPYIMTYLTGIVVNMDDGSPQSLHERLSAEKLLAGAKSDALSMLEAILDRQHIAYSRMDSPQQTRR
jgi:hypothetical protein